MQLSSPAALTSGHATINGGQLDLAGQNATLDSLQGYGGAVVNSGSTAALTINSSSGAANYHGSMAGNVTVSANGYGGSSSGYGGSSSGYGGSSSGYGGSASGYGGSSSGYGESSSGYGGSSSGYGGSSSGYGGSSSGYGGSSSGYGGSSSGYGGDPLISDFSCEEGPTVCTFTGTVTDPNQNPAGLTITFGGLLAGDSTTVGSDGTFMYSVAIPDNTSGTVTAQTVDYTDHTSNVAMDYVSTSGVGNGYGGSAGTGSSASGSSSGYGGSSSGYGGSSSGYGGSSSGYGGSSSGYGGSSSGYGGSSSGYGGSSSGYGGSSSGYGGSSSGYGGSSSGYGGDPLISNFSCEEGPTVCTFTGTVTDPNQNPQGLTITFGGLLAGDSTTVDSDGTFMYSVAIPDNTSGTVTAQTVDYTDHTSNVAMDYVSTSGVGNGYGGTSGSGSSSGGSSNGYGGATNGYGGTDTGSSNGYGGSSGDGGSGGNSGGGTSGGSGSSSAVPSVAVNFVQNAVQGSTPGIIDLYRSGDSSQPLTVEYQIDQSFAGTAVYGADAEYVGPNITDGPAHGMLTGTATFEAGSAYADITIDASRDADGQINPIVSFMLVNPDGSVPLAAGVAGNSYVVSNGSASVMLQTSLVFVNDGGTVDMDEKAAAHRVIYQMTPFEDLSPQSTISYAITGGNSDNLFQINNNGQITLAQDASHATQSQYELTIRAQGQNPNTNVSFSTITIQMVSTVGVYGDTEAVRGSNGDTITLAFQRFTNDLSAALNVRFAVQWGTPDSAISNTAASLNDFVQDEAAAILQDGQITIPAGQATTTLTLTAAPLANGEQPVGIRSVRLDLLASTDANGQNYQTASHDSSVGKPTAASALGSVWLYVLDGVTAFAAENANPNLADMPTQDNNPGIDPNDVRQGGLGDCYFMAAELALAKSNYQQLENLITENGDGSFTVHLFNAHANAWQQFNISGNILANGWNMAELSGDFDPATGKVEIWPQLLEEAWADMHSGYQSIWSGSVASAWMALTGNNAQDASIAGLSNTDILGLIEMDLASGQQVSIATRKPSPGEQPIVGVNNQKIHFDHAYIVEEVVADPNSNGYLGVQLINPWGVTGSDPNPILPLSDLGDLISGVFILSNQ